MKDVVWRDQSFMKKWVGLVIRNDKEEIGNFKQFKELMPYMKVMARARPMDKYLMVTGLRQMGAVRRCNR
jgi:magnesium-transporting ATPase (P-type)